MIRVLDAHIIQCYVLEVSFADGTIRHVDVEPALWGPVFEPLRDPELFLEGRFDSEAETITWPNGADFAPEFLHDGGVVVAQRASA
jgi:hypothetical protein